VGTVIASGGYPGQYEKGFPIYGLDEIDEEEDGLIFQAGTKSEEEMIVTHGGRVLCLVGLDEDFRIAKQKSLELAKKINFDGMMFRKDIGNKELKRPTVGILMGSDSDLKVMETCAKILQDFDIPYEIHISSAHRNSARTAEIIDLMVNRGVQVIIAAAGGAAHLAGMVASRTNIPVIGVPLASTPLSGLDALFSTVQMPPGIPVASVAIGEFGAKNAALFALQILGLKDDNLAYKLEQQREQVFRDMAAKDKKLQEKGPFKYFF